MNSVEIRFFSVLEQNYGRQKKIKQTGKFENEHVLFKVSITGAVTLVILFYSIAQVIKSSYVTYYKTLLCLLLQDHDPSPQCFQTGST